MHTHAPERVAELRTMAARLLPKEQILTMDNSPGAFGFAVVGAAD